MFHSSLFWFGRHGLRSRAAGAFRWVKKHRGTFLKAAAVTAAAVVVSSLGESGGGSSMRQHMEQPCHQRNKRRSEPASPHHSC